MLQVKYQSKPIGQMSAVELVQAVSTVIIKIHVITGWIIPQKEFVDILVDQLTKKFVESYPAVNIDEIEYAFRNDTSVKDWGKAMNLCLIDEVMVPYLDARFELSRLEEQARKPKVLQASSEEGNREIIDEELLKTTFECYKLIKNPFVIPESVFFYLEKTGKLVMSNRQKWVIMQRINCPDPEKKKGTCRKVAVSEYFNELILNGRPLH